MRASPTYLLIITALFACGGSGSSNSDSGTPVKDPPQVFLDVPNRNVIGTELDVLVSVNGCDQVSQAELLDNGTQIATFAFTTSPTQVALQTNQIPYTTGISAHLSLTAKLTCDDGRSNTSTPQAADFFPVAQVYTSSTGSPVVPTEFFADGSGASVSFVGCNQGALVRVNTSGTVLKSVSSPVGCQTSSWFTEKVNGVRWMVTPPSQGGGASGAAAFLDDPGQADDLTFTGVARDSAGPISVGNLGVGPDGDAIVMGTSTATPDDWIFRVAHDNCVGGNCTLWSAGTDETDLTTYETSRLPLGNPVITSSLEVFFPAYWLESTPTQRITHYDVEHRDYATGGLLTDPPTKLSTYTGGLMDGALKLPMTMSDDGSVVYLAFNDVTPGTFDVYGCSSTTASPGNFSCDSPSLNATQLSGSALAAIPFGIGGAYVAGIGSQHTYFFKPGSNTILNPGGAPIDVTGSLVTMQIQAGKTTDFYLLNGDGSTLPTEVVGIDRPENGELFRYEVNGNSVAIAVDDSGQVWLRVGSSLVQTLPNATYRSLRGG